MTDSDITGNITADCGQIPQRQEMIEGHESGCTCDSCCELSESNCQDNLDQCEQTQQPSGGMKGMKTKLRPIMANCAVLLAILTLSVVVARAGTIRSVDAIQINPAIENHIAITDIGIVVTDIKHAASVDGNDVIGNIVGVDPIQISNLNSQVDEIAINVENKVVDTGEAISPIYPTVSNYIDTSVDRDLSAKRN